MSNRILVLLTLLAVCCPTLRAQTELFPKTAKFNDEQRNGASKGALDRAALPEAPSFSGAPVAKTQSGITYNPQQISQLCWDHRLDKKTCSFHWHTFFPEVLEDLTMMTVGNIVKDPGIRNAVTHDPFFSSWFQSVENYRYTRWNDDAPFLDHYVGHPFMGSLTQYIWIQNDPYAKTLTIEKNREYWITRLRAEVFTVLYDFQWKLGPVSEASIGNAGLVTYYGPDIHRYTNDTGLAPLVTTPVGGFAWMMAEDTLDRYVLGVWDQKTHNPVYLFGMSFLNPTRGVGNLFRYRAPWYRDYRTVKAHWRKQKSAEFTPSNLR